MTQTKQQWRKHHQQTDPTEGRIAGMKNRLKKAILKHTSKMKICMISNDSGAGQETKSKNSCCSVIRAEIKLEKSYKNFQSGIINVHQNIRGK